MQTRIERRMRGGFMFLANYTWSKNMKATNYLNPTDTHPEHVIETTDPGQVLTLGGVYEIPFGRGRHWGKSWHGVVNHVLADGSLAQSSRHSAECHQYIGDLVLLLAKQCAMPFAKSSALGTVDGSALRHSIRNSDIQPAWNHIRTLSTGFNFLRGPGYWTLDADVSKTFVIGEQFRLQFRCEAYNLTNKVNMGQWTALQFDYPGYIDGYTNGTPRVIQLGLRLSF